MSDPKKIEEELLSFLNQDAKDLLVVVKALETNALQRAQMAADIDKRFNLDKANDPDASRLKQKMLEDPDYMFLSNNAELLRQSIFFYLDRWSREYSLKTNNPPTPSAAASKKTLN